MLKLNEIENTPLIKTVLYIDIVELLLGKDGIDINSKNNYGITPLINATLNNHVNYY